MRLRWAGPDLAEECGADAGLGMGGKAVGGALNGAEAGALGAGGGEAVAHALAEIGDARAGVEGEDLHAV